MTRCACLLTFSWELIALTHGWLAQAKLTWVPGSVPSTHPKTVTHQGTSRARRSVTRDQRVTTKANRHHKLVDEL